MTAGTTIFGLLPTALATRARSEANVPLAVAVIGGTFVAALLTLYIVPILFLLIAKSPTGESADLEPQLASQSSGQSGGQFGGQTQDGTRDKLHDE